jgi:TP901 family phage tail tape measure protein
MAVQINVAANQAALTASIQAGVQAYNQRFAQNNQLNLTVNQRAFSQPLGRMTGDVKDFEAALAASNARVIAFGASTAVLGGVIRSFKELANVTIDVEKNLADINRVFGLTTSQLQKFSTDLFGVGKQTASTFDDASKAALEFSRQGLKAEEVLVRTKDALTLTRLAGIGTANAVDALTSTVNGFAATGITTTQILNKLVAVEQDYAVGAGDLAEALSRTGQAAQEAGVSLDQLNALVTSAQQSTARGGAVIGNALKTIFTRLQRTETLDQLEAFNIAVRDVQGNILPAVTVLQNFAGAYKNLGDAQRAQLSEQVAGVYQVNILKAIVGDLNKSQGVYAGALQRGASATNEAEVATAKLNQTLDALLKQTATSTQQLANNIGKVTFEPLAKYGTEQLKSFVESMNEVLEGEGVGSTFANGLLKGIRNVIAGPGAIAAFFTLFKLIQNSFTYLSQALPQIAGITTETQNRKNIEASILQIMQQQGPVSQALAGTMGNQAAQAQLLLQVARQQTAEYQMQTTLAKQLAVQLAGQGVRVKGSGGLQVTRAGGYIPAATRMAEVVGAQAGGYAPGRVVSSPVGGVMNTAEDVKYIPGFAQPFINPPAGSKAGRAHRQNSISRTGVDPYIFNGFIPNFASGKYFDFDQSNNNLNLKLNGLKIPKNKEFDYIVDTNKDSVSNLQYKIVLSSSKAALSKRFDNAMANPETAKEFLKYSSLKNEDQKNLFSLNYARYTASKKDFEVSPFEKNKKEKILFSNQLKGIKSDTLGRYYEEFLATKFGLKRNEKQTDISNLDFIGAEAKAGDYSYANLLAKAIRNKAQTLFGKKSYYKNKKPNDIDFNNQALTLYTTNASQGFIPNFATPMTTASIPWFKKYSSKYKNATGDTDLFKMGDFPTYGKGLNHEYAKKGNANMLSYLHEDFVRSALNIALGSKKVIRPSEVGFKNKPIGDIANSNDFDLLYKIADGSYSMLELKQDFKNMSGSVTGFMNKKLENAKKENPELAKKVSSMIAVSNRPKFTDPTGRNAGANFSEFEMAAASIVKDKYSNVDPLISTKLTKVTDGLLRRYEAKKNTTYGGFIPNFAKELQATAGYGSSIYGELNKNKLSIESMDRGNYPIKDPASKKRSVSNILYSGIIEKAKKIIGKDKDLFITGELLPQDKGLAFPQGLSRVKLAKTAIGNLVDPKGTSKKLNKEQLLNLLIDPKQQQYLRDSLLELTTTHSKGFIPNFANFIDVDTLGKNSVHYSGDLMKLIKDIESSIGRNLSSGELRFLTNPKTNLSKLNDPKILNRFINSERKGGFAQFAKGFLPNFAYKQAVMGLEESMSGNKAIFDTKPFPHIRNSSQPTFSSAIADHGGLSNALSDSMRGQKNAGLMNKGYVPNFAKGNKGKKNQPRNTQSSSNAVEVESYIENYAQEALRDIKGTYKSTIDKIKSMFSKVDSSVSSVGIDAVQSLRDRTFRQSRNAPEKNIPKSTFSENLSKASTAIAIAGPMLAGFAEQAMYGNRKRTEMTSGERMSQSALSTGLSSLSTGAGIGASFGLPGAIIGGAIGGLVGLTSALNATILTAEELAQLNDEQAQKSQASISAASSYIEAQKSLSEMIVNGASSNDIENATKKLSSGFNEIADVKLQEIFNSTGGNIAEMTKQLQEYTNEATSRQAFKKAITSKGTAEDLAKNLSIGLNTKEKKQTFSSFLAEISIQKELEKASLEGYQYDEQTLSARLKNNKEIKKALDAVLLSQGVTKESENYASEFSAAIESFLSKTFEKAESLINKSDVGSNVQKNINDFRQAATKSFGEIFRKIERDLNKNLFDIALSFEKDSSTRRIQSSILDFSTNFQDSINSFISSNLPDVRKFDFAANIASQKAQMLLQKSQQDYDKAIAEQDNEKSNFLTKNAQELSGSFKSSLSNSQVNAEFYKNKVLPQIQSGNYSGDVSGIISSLKEAQLNKVKETRVSANDALGGAGGLGFGNTEEIKTTLESLAKILENPALAEENKSKIIAYQQELINYQETTLKFANQAEKDKLSAILTEKAEAQTLFEQKQANAKKELEINKQLSEAKIAVEKDIAIEKAKVDKANLARMESMKNLSATIGNRLDISKAESGSRVAAFQRQLNDPTQTYGMGAAQITERRIKLQSDILKEQRTAEDQAINAEIQQRMLEMAAEQENTAATLKLNDTIMALIETQLRGALGGTGNIEKIFNTIQTAGPQEVDNVYGAGTYAQYQALQRIEESRTASAANNPVYNSKTFEDAIAKAGFNNVGGKGMSELEQRNFLSAEQLKAEQAGNVVLANTIRRYREQIEAKQQVLNITRKQIDADVQLQATTDRQLSSIRGRVAKGFGELNDEGDKLILNLGENLPRMFADGMVNGIKAAIKESDNLGDALMGVAASFLDSISTTLMQAGTYKILGSLGIDNLLMKQSGGLIRAQSGMYVSGTGSGDKYPAMLENGEYVLNRNAVMAMGGPSELDKLNFSMAPRFASGGSFVTELNDLNSMEEGMTTYGLENSKLYNELRDLERAKQAEKRRKAFERKKMITGIVGSVAGIAASFGIAKAAGSFGSSLKKDFGDVTMNVTPEQLAQNANLAQKGGHIGTRLSDTIPAYAEGGLYSSPIIKKYGVGMQNGGMYGGSSNNSNTVSNTNATNSFNFNTTVNRDGTIQMGADSTSYKQQDVELSNNLNSQVYKTVLDVIKQQQRFGGTLAGTRRPI